MACNNIEIEIQVNIENSQPLLDFLATAGTFKQEVHQVDEYFSPGHKDFLAVRPVSEWLRLREADGVFFWNYKNWHFTDQGESHHCDEFETKLDNVEAARRILQALNFTSLAVVDKLRRIWEYKNYEIALDSVRGLGDFVEIEYIGTDEKIDPAV
ncbi:MAG: class IV adenylate cyclase, partial [Candidatus Falkowbacteria bacterium]|nr:class IV adenylate cyclase [Candidatus Falkowbacteria bacterium]